MSIRGYGAAILCMAALVVTTDAAARVFYCGHIDFSFNEEGSADYDHRYENGDRTKIKKSLITRFGGRWPICLECSGDKDAAFLACSGQGVGPLRSFQFAMHSDREKLDASAGCGTGSAKRGRRAREVQNTIGFAPDPVAIAAALNVMGSEYHIMAGPAGDPSPQISIIDRHERKTTHPCAPPETETGEEHLALPLMVLFSDTQAWTTGDHLAGVAPIEDVSGCTGSDAGFCTECGEGWGCNYAKQIKASWSLKRRVSDCTARVNMARGDVRLNGEPVPTSGDVPMGPGDVITTGRGARAQFQFGGKAILRVGPSSQAKLNRDLCEPKPGVDLTEDLATGPASALFLHLSGDEGKFTISTGTTGGGGVRGDLGNPKKRLFSLVAAAHAADPEEFQDPKRVAAPTDWPGGGRAVYVKSEENGRVTVKALRGRVRVEDPDAKRVVDLKPDEVYQNTNPSRRNPIRVTLMGKGAS